MKPKTQVMLDLETLGQKPGAIIVAIGAVRFAHGKIQDEFYERVSAESGERYGLTMDASTVLWWLKQSDAARAELNAPAQELGQALLNFNRFLNGEEVLLWGNGSDFDNALLRAAYDRYPMALPWKYWNNRCYRTVKALHPDIPVSHPATKHHALEDARAQALHLMQLLAFY